MLRLGKVALLSAASATGASRLVGNSEWRRRRLLILCYHGVAQKDEAEWNPELYVTPDHLRRRFELLRSLDANVLSLDEAVTRLGEGTLPDRSVALTFDDGAVDFARQAVPILEEFRYPATVYLTTYYVGRPLPVWSVMVSYLLWHGRHDTAAELSAFGIVGRRVDLSDAATRRQAAEEIQQAHLQCTTAELDAMLETLATHVGAPMGEIRSRRLLQLMTPDEVRALPRDLVQVELHTHRHRTPNESEAYRRELRENGEIISALRGMSPRHFCYPSGRFSDVGREALRAEGIVSATTCQTGLASADLNPLMLPRLIDTMRTPVSVFEAWVTGAAAFLPRRGGRDEN